MDNTVHVTWISYQPIFIRTQSGNVITCSPTQSVLFVLCCHVWESYMSISLQVFFLIQNHPFFICIHFFFHLFMHVCVCRPLTSVWAAGLWTKLIFGVNIFLIIIETIFKKKKLGIVYGIISLFCQNIVFWIQLQSRRLFLILIHTIYKWPTSFGTNC